MDNMSNSMSKYLIEVFSQDFTSKCFLEDSSKEKKYGT